MKYQMNPNTAVMELSARSNQNAAKPILKSLALLCPLALLAAMLALESPAQADSSGHQAGSTSDYDSVTSAIEIPFIGPGTSRSVILSELGEPAQIINQDTYVYKSRRPDQNTEGATLVVNFADDKVSSLRFPNKEAAPVVAYNAARQGGNSRITGFAESNK